jgi:hypothetical protein
LSATPFASFRAVDAAIEGLQSVKPYSWVNVMERERNPWENTFSPRIIQRKIGQVLKAQYDQDLAQPLPHRLLTLLMQLNGQQITDRDKRPEWNKPAR